MSRNLSWKLAMTAMSLGLCMMAGTIRLAYPEWGNFQPLLSFLGGFAMAAAIFVNMPPYPDPGQ